MSFVFCLVSCVVVSLCLSQSSFSQELDELSAEQKAREAHELASSDMIYQQEEWKALYYQNIQIINLLKEIRELMRSQNEQAAKAAQKS